ncbi:MAG: flagellar biosynthetic protein FliO [Candidatus Eisenbacteria sp.]|nr:flagellar biosynthetic protein FliO [Candidatus Eisenbacteria bacterium]
MSEPLTLSAGAMLLRVVLALGLVFGLLAAVLYLYRRASRRGTASARRSRIEIIAQRSLGSRTSLALVEVAGEALLIGITPQQISALRTLGVPAKAPGTAAAQSALAVAGGTGPLGVGALGRIAGETPAGNMAPRPTALGEEAADSPFAATLRGEVHRVGRHLAAVLAGDTGRRGDPGRGEA